MIQGIKKYMEQQIVQVLAEYPAIKKALVYGSRAKNTYRRGSDIDLALIGKRLDFDMLLRIKLQLDDLLLPYKMDVCLYDNLKDIPLREEIDRWGRTIYSKKPLRPSKRGAALFTSAS